MNFGEFINGKPQQPLPEVLSRREADLDAFQNYCYNLMLKILTLFAVGLGVRLHDPPVPPKINQLTHPG